MPTNEPDGMLCCRCGYPATHFHEDYGNVCSDCAVHWTEKGDHESSPKPVVVKLKYDLPQRIEGGRFTTGEIRRAWFRQPVELYGPVFQDGAFKYISCRLALPGAAAFSCVGLDEIDGPLPENIPAQPSYHGLVGCVEQLGD